MMTSESSGNKTHFGYEQVAEAEKEQRVAAVFDSVARRYDLMNDLMSGGLHRLWKVFTIDRSGVRAGSRVLDVAGGTGDLSLAFARKVADRVAFLHQGELVEVGTPEQIFEHPQRPETREFLARLREPTNEGFSRADEGSYM